MAKKETTEFRLIPIPGGKFDRFIREKESIPRDSNDYLYSLADIYGTDEVMNMAEVPVGDYVYNKGLIHAMNMNVGRAIPWIEDGLKSVERRVIYTMYARGYYGKKTAKVATIVGDMISLVYPHGDQAPADTVYRLGRSYSMMIPYVRPVGNYGNMETMKPAAPRYAAGSMSDYAYDCFFGDTGPIQPLYDEKDSYQYDGKEPIYLISRYPNILMQWNQGIGKGASSWLGAFNSIDIFKTTLKLMDDPYAEVDIYPDTPIPVNIVNKDELAGCFDRKQFTVRMRAPYHTEVDKRRTSSGKTENKYTIVFTALPLGVIGKLVADEIIALKEEDSKRTSKRIPEVIDVETVAELDGLSGVRVIVEYEYGYDPAVLAEKLYKSTSLAKDIGVKYNLIYGNQPITMTPRRVLLSWISQRYDQKRRYYHQLVLKAAADRATYEAMARIVSSRDATDKAINIIRGSKEKDEAVQKLCKEFDFTEFQAKVVMRIRLENLPKVDVQETIRKRDQAIADYKKYRKLLSDEGAIKEAVRAELKEGMKKYGQERRATLMNLETDTASIVSASTVKYVLYNRDYYFCTDDLSRLSRIIANVDSGYRMVEVRNGDDVLIFTSKGYMRMLNGFSFSVNDAGIAISTLGVDDAVSIVPVESQSGTDIVLVTEQGYGKRVAASEVMKNTAAARRKVINLNEGDLLAAAVRADSDSHPDSIVGMIDRDRMYYLKLEDFPVYKISSAGNRMIKGVNDLHISGAVYLPATDDSDFLLIYAESGYVKLLDTGLLGFARRGNNTVVLSGKTIMGATLLHGSSAEMQLYSSSCANGRMKISLEIGRMVKFHTESGEEQKFRMSTSIGSPVKVLRTGRHEWYAMI